MEAEKNDELGDPYFFGVQTLRHGGCFYPQTLDTEQCVMWRRLQQEPNIRIRINHTENITAQLSGPVICSQRGG